MPILTDEHQTLLQYVTCGNQIPDDSLVSLQLQVGVRPVWSDSYQRKVRSINNNPFEFKKINSHLKTYTWTKQIPLNADNNNPLENSALLTSLRNRTSERNLSNSPIQFEELASLLQFSFGKKHRIKTNSSSGLQPHSFRINPSGGRRYPLEVYVLCQNVKDLDSGLYHYNVKLNSLEQLRAEDTYPLLSSFFGQSTIGDLKNISVAIFITAIPTRSSQKYGPLSFRLIFLEAGHLGQSVWLIATALNLKCRPQTLLDEKSFYTAFNLNSHQEFFVYSLILGH